MRQRNESAEAALILGDSVPAREVHQQPSNFEQPTQPSHLVICRIKLNLSLKSILPPRVHWGGGWNVINPD